MVKKAERAKQAKLQALDAGMEGKDVPRPRPSKDIGDARAFAIQCAKTMQSDQCEDLVILDLHEVSPVTDFFVIGTGTSDRQMHAVADNIKHMAKDLGEIPFSVDGYDEGSWIIMDYIDVIVHVFDSEKRAYYDLDSLWGDNPKVPWEE